MMIQKGHEKMQVTDRTARFGGGPADKTQRLRLQRFAMAGATYAACILATVVIGRLGLGSLSTTQWAVFIALALAINLGFYGLLRSDRNLRFKDPSMTAPQIIVSSMWGLIPLYALPNARPLVLMFYLPSFGFGMLKLSSREYLGMAWIIMGEYGALLVTEYFLGRRPFHTGYELFLFILYGLLLVWYALFGGMVSRLRLKLRAQLQSTELLLDELRTEVRKRQNTQAENERLIVELKQSLADVRKLGGLLPICASCKKIRDDQGYWNQIEAFIASRSEAKFSHGICPDCVERLYPEPTNKPGPGIV